ncbi:MAG: LysR family transcriptional regulator [Gammaproteobacteria bacterium]|nr:LysR family transcriptional regulator [Gammaproteobacteria bacterium]
MIICLRSFECVASLGTVTAAAKSMNLTQSAVSQQIKLLEAHLEKLLFRREGRRLVLTEEGQKYLFYVNEALDFIRLGTRSIFRDEHESSLRIRSNLAFTLFWLMPRLSNFYKQNPDINLNIMTHVWDTGLSSSPFSIDIRLGIKLSDDNFRPLQMEEFFPVCSPAVLLAGDLASLPRFDGPSLTANWERWHRSEKWDLPWKSVNITSTMVVALTAAINSAGLALAHSTVAEHLFATGALVRPFEGSIPMSERYFISDPPQRQRTPAMESFLGWMWEQISD